MNEERLAGYVTVDSGQLMVVDPAYVLEGEFEDEQTDYGAMCRVIHTSDSGSGEWVASGVAGTAVGSVVNGDGRFPVYIEENSDDGIVALHIRLIDRGGPKVTAVLPPEGWEGTGPTIKVNKD